MNFISEEEYKRYSTVILANGEVPEGEVPVAFLRSAERIVCCDGAVDKLLQLGFEPTVIVGDCDSISEKNREKLKLKIVADKSTDYNDLQKALKHCKSNKYNNIAVLGAGGLRGDHYLANLSILDMYSDTMDLLMADNEGVFDFISSKRNFASFPGQEVSIFSLNMQAVFTFAGLKYPVCNRKFNYLWEGSLNVATGDSFSIDIKGGKAVVYRCYR